LSPENIIVDNRHTDPEFFLIDFDLSVSSSQNNKTPFRGTFQYIPPETEYESGVIMEGEALVRSFERWSVIAVVPAEVVGKADVDKPSKVMNHYFKS
jgi:serine/threonine protein kinase